MPQSYSPILLSSKVELFVKHNILKLNGYCCISIYNSENGLFRLNIAIHSCNLIIPEATSGVLYIPGETELHGNTLSQKECSIG